MMMMMMIQCCRGLFIKCGYCRRSTVNHEVMWRILKARGVHPKLLALIKDLYSGSRARVTAHGTESGWFDIRTGVRTRVPPKV